MPIEAKIDNEENKQTNNIENDEVLEKKDKDINILKNEIDLTYLKDYISKNFKNGTNEIENISEKINDKEVYYVPVEDGKGNIVRYKAMYIDNDNSNEIIRFPITDLDGNILRIQTIARYKPLERPLFDPIDFIALGGGILRSFLKGLATLAPKTGINLSKTAIVKMGRGDLMFSVVGKEIPKDVMGNVIAQGFQN